MGFSAAGGSKVVMLWPSVPGAGRDVAAAAETQRLHASYYARWLAGQDGILKSARQSEALGSPKEPHTTRSRVCTMSITTLDGVPVTFFQGEKGMGVAERRRATARAPKLPAWWAM